MRSVVVTGIGLVTPLGLTTQTSWNRCLAGESGIGPVTRVRAERFPTQIAGEIKGFDPSQFFELKEIKRFDPFIQYAVASATEALSDACLKITPENSEMVGIVIGSGIGGIMSISETTLKLAQEGPRFVTPFFIPSAIINMSSGYLAIRTEGGTEVVKEIRYHNE